MEDIALGTLPRDMYDSDADGSIHEDDDDSATAESPSARAHLDAVLGPAEARGM